jgi:hypothetical protein
VDDIGKARLDMLLSRVMGAAGDYQDAMSDLQDFCKEHEIVADIPCIIPEDGFHPLEELIDSD